MEWERVITALEEGGKWNLLRIYQEAKLRSWKDDEIRACFSKDSFQADSAVKEENVAEMKEILAAKYRKPIKFTVELLSAAEVESQPAMKSVVEHDAEQRSNERATREEEARSHPLTKVVMETFGASIKEIKTDV